MFCVRQNRKVLRATRAVRRLRVPVLGGVRHYNFGSEQYASCFGNLELADSKTIRKGAIEAIKQYDATLWYSDPIRTVIMGEKIASDDGCVDVTTVDAFNNENGKMVHASSAITDKVIEHMASYTPPTRDLRVVMRKIEQELLSTHAPALVAMQALDFHKQDGITEMEESAEANTVERRLNDSLLADEEKGIIEISRAHAMCGCVSNFSIFLDLFRKTLRNLELGVPVVVLSRSNTAQHTYRWFQLLQQLMQEHGVDSGMLTHASCNVGQQRRIMAANPGSPLYFTGSRPVAEAIKEICPKLMASTGGPNTMVATEWSADIGNAVMLSASIENSGQCTALRHVVAPATGADLQTAFDVMPMLKDTQDALEQSSFAGVYEANAGMTPDEGYTLHPTRPVSFRVNQEGTLPPDDLNEKWREVYVDLTSASADTINSDTFKDKTAAWLNHHQPISLAVNGRTWDESFALLDYLFERTSMVVNTVGCGSDAALTAQARPQDAEIFGEFPPRHELTKYTRFPVVGPSATPGYNAHYNQSWLESEAAKACPRAFASCSELLDAVTKPMRGYLLTLIQYLSEAAKPRRSYGTVRTALWGLQRPPIGSESVVLRCDANTTADALAMYLIPFVVTNANTQVRVSLTSDSPAMEVVKTIPASANITTTVEDDRTFVAGVEATHPWNVITPNMDASETANLPLVGHHVSLLFPLGHIKSTRPGDEAFAKALITSRKWLRIREE